jgi:DNA-binding transcriptional LysR family regulator
MNAERWSDLEVLGRILEGKTLSAAARAMGVDQTTVSRRLAVLERRIGAPLFNRIDGRLVATPELARVEPGLRLIAEEAAAALSALKRGTAELRGSVRITSVGFLLSRVLAPALAILDASHPGITVELIAEDRALSFARREADIALRLGRMAEDSIRIRQVGTLAFALFLPAAQPVSDDFPVVRYGEALEHLPEMQALLRACPAARTAFRANRLDILVEAALSLGAGIMLPLPMGDRDPRFRRAARQESDAKRPLFLLLHPERARIPTVAQAAIWVESSLNRRNARG